MTMNERRAEIMRILTARRSITMPELARTFQVTTRTIQNDVVALTVDYPLETQQGKGGCVRVAQWYHPHRNILSGEQQRVLAEIMQTASEQQAKVLREMLLEYYKARIANQIPFEKVLRGNPHCTFAVNFRCYPFFYADAAADITVTTSGTIITNPGSVYSEPILTVTGSGNITLMVGLTIVELENISGSIVIDSVLQEAYQGTTLMNNHMNGEFPVLKPGANAISWTGTVTKVVVRPNWRYL